jgi:hypothetical protein
LPYLKKLFQLKVLLPIVGWFNFLHPRTKNSFLWTQGPGNLTWQVKTYSHFSFPLKILIQT